jgi:hypothetical protein
MAADEADFRRTPMSGEDMIAMHTVDRRWNARRTFITAVTLYYRDFPAAQCKTRDIGAEGVFVEIEPAPFDLRDMLEVSLPGSVVGAHPMRRIPAMVAHKRATGLGLMFCSFEQRLFERLAALVVSLPSSHAA